MRRQGGFLQSNGNAGGSAGNLPSHQAAVLTCLGAVGIISECPSGLYTYRSADLQATRLVHQDERWPSCLQLGIHGGVEPPSSAGRQSRPCSVPCCCRPTRAVAVRHAVAIRRRQLAIRHSPGLSATLNPDAVERYSRRCQQAGEYRSYAPLGGHD